MEYKLKDLDVKWRRMVMKKLITRFLFGVAIFIVGTLGFASAQSPEVIAKAYDNTYHTAQMTAADKSLCSATAIGPQALLTATHCELPSNQLTLQGKGNNPDITVIIDKQIRDGSDHTILLISGYKFLSYALVDLEHKFDFGQDVFIIGNPHGFSNVFRRGYVAGSSSFSGFTEGIIPEVLLEIHTGEGDSGAAMFDANGTVIGLIDGNDIHGNSLDDPQRFVMSYALVFTLTPDQIKEAVAYSTVK
jgi:hypothetical protein